jgi:hypothetical protein
MSRRRGMLGSGEPDTSPESLVSKAMAPQTPKPAAPIDLLLTGVNPIPRRSRPKSRPSRIDYARR